MQCSVYAHHGDDCRYLFVLEGQMFPRDHVPDDWRIVAHGVTPSRRVIPWLKINGSHQVFQTHTESAATLGDCPC